MNKRFLVTMLLLFLGIGCDNNDEIEQNELYGTWTTTFETIWNDGGMWDPPYDPDTTIHTSNLTIQEDIFAINITPPVYSGHLGIRFGNPRSQWFGSFEDYHDTLHFVLDDSTGDQRFYYSIIHADTLELEIIHEENPFDSLIAWYSIGGLPWGNNYMHSSGRFIRVED